MSSAANHAKRSHRSETMKGSALQAHARQNYRSQAYRAAAQHKNPFRRIFTKLTGNPARSAPRQNTD